ncbi:Uncharacterised protein [Mycobacteroides abscessus subsp. abscessus]|nr:Uncharacterised protein [Mycobacteroides abscessus subsp. abscessus]
MHPLGQVGDLGVDLDAALGAQGAGLGDADPRDVHGGHTVSAFGQPDAVATLPITQAQHP